VTDENRSDPFSQVHGILLLDKPSGLSSNAALQRVRRLFGRATAGHTGSLDPLATGMLPICLGEATKVAGLLLGASKAYVAEVELGRRTATGDAEGEVIERASVPALARSLVEERLSKLVGPLAQRPPMYSAVHVNGQRLYRLARQGLEVDRPARTVHVYSLELEDFATPRLRLKIVCSTGTYIRTLAESIAEALGTVGYVAGLHRLWVDPFARDRMHTLEELAAAAASGAEALLALLLPIERALVGMAEVHVESGAARRLAQGQLVAVSGSPGLKAVYGPERCVLGLAELSADGFLHAKRLFTWAIGSMACAKPMAVESAPHRR
jgi:tRNA pseudouridine55 synthase